MTESCGDDLSGGRCRNAKTVKVPLADGCGCGGTLEAADNTERPEIDEHEKHTQPPSTCIEDEEAFGVGGVSSEEDSGKHSHPYPGPNDDSQ